VSEAKTPLILNPGSCARPRGAFPPSFALVSFPGVTEYYNIQFYAIQKSAFGGVAFIAMPLRKF
jgi:predicted phosphodiesterase